MYLCNLSLIFGIFCFKALIDFFDGLVILVFLAFVVLAVLAFGFGLLADVGLLCAALACEL